MTKSNTHPRRNRNFTIGTKVIAVDDAGTILETDVNEAPLWAADGKHVLVGWQSGVNTWTLTSDLKRA
jgi:hypothetical protein